MRRRVRCVGASGQLSRRSSGIRDMQDQVEEIEAAAERLARLLCRIDFENGHVSWTREMSIAQQRLEESVMWAVKAIKLPRPVLD